jgi:complement component 1 Q subcomponent-binding protein
VQSYHPEPHLFRVKQVEEIPENFPFKITDKKGLNEITLTRTYQGEKIEVLVSMPSLVTGDEAEHDQDEDDKEKDDDQEDGEKAPKSTIPLIVTVSKSDGPSLEFTCTAYPDEILIDTLSVKQPAANEDEELIAYEGPDFK